MADQLNIGYSIWLNCIVRHLACTEWHLYYIVPNKREYNTV